MEIHNIRRDLKALLPLHPQLEVNDNSKGDGGPINGLPHGYRWVGTDVEPTPGITLPEALYLVMVERYLSQSLPVLLTHSLHDLFQKAQQTLLSPISDPSVLTAVHEALLKERQLQVSYQSIHQEIGKEKTTDYILWVWFNEAL